MRGVILAGGRGTRLQPLTLAVNKALLPVGMVPLFYHHLYLMAEAGIGDVLVVSTPEDSGDIMRACGSGLAHGLSLTYRVQDKPDGIASALKLAEDFVRDEPFVVLLGDNLFFPRADAVGPIRDFVASDLKYRLFVVRRDDPRAFGVAIWRDGKVIDIIEKPAEVVSRDAVVGLYCYKPDIFPILRELKPSARGELEISDLNRRLVQDGGGDVTRLHMEWIDAGTPHQLKRANELAWRASCL